MSTGALLLASLLPTPKSSPDPSHQTRLSPRAGKVLPVTLLLGNVEVYKHRH